MAIRTLVVVGMVLAAALARLLPHPPNFTPIGALALFGAAHFRPAWGALLLPVVAMFISDLGLQLGSSLGWYGGWMAGGTGFHQGMLAVYGTVMLIAALGLLLRSRTTGMNVAAAVLASAVLFFVITNFAVWAEGSLYPRTLEGLLTCYTLAIPFFHWTLLGDACYATILFGGLALAEQRFPVLQPATG
jgi:hypothetical protein